MLEQVLVATEVVVPLDHLIPKLGHSPLPLLPLGDSRAVIGRGGRILQRQQHCLPRLPTTLLKV